AVRRPWRRFLRFSVRGGVVVVLVIGGWLGWIVRSAGIQREAVEEIEKTAAGVRYHWEWKNDSWDPSVPIWAPKWLLDRFGIDYFDHVAAVSLQGLEPNRLMIQVGHFDRLEMLELVGQPLSDAELAHISQLNHLKNLDLGWTKVTDAGLL